MKQINFFHVLMLLPFVAFLSSCSDNNEAITPKGTAVKSIEASTNFDLSHRSDWVLSMSGYKYDFTVDGNALKGIPQDEPFHYSYGQETTNGATEFILRPPVKDTRDIGPVIPPTADQSTWEKLIGYDLLRGIYSGNVVENITGVTFLHHDALLDFTMTNLPPNAQVFVVQWDGDQIITPFYDEETESYKAIVAQQNTLQSIYIMVEANGKRYFTSLHSESDETRSMAYNKFTSAVVNFNVDVNDEEETLEVGKLKIDYFSKEWPLRW